VTNILSLTLRLHYAFAQKTFVGPRSWSEAAHRTPPGSFALCESEATATNVLSARKRSVSDKCFICAKAKRQRQMFYLRESEASAANVLSARKRSISDKCFICAKAKRQQQCFICAKAKRQQQSAQPERKSTTRYGDEP